MIYIALINLFLYPLVCFAVSSDEIPFYEAITPSSKYTEALRYSQRALVAQYGLLDGVNQVQDFMLHKSESELRDFLDSGIPGSSDRIFFCAGVLYTLQVKKEVKRTFKTPFLSGWHNTVTVSKDQQMLSFSYNF